MKNEVIEVLSLEHGQEVKKYFEGRGVDTKHRGFDATLNRWYGVINGNFDNYGLSYVERTNTEIITLSEPFNPKRGDKVLVSDDEKKLGCGYV